MEAFKKSYIHFITAFAYLYHLGSWTYSVENFSIAHFFNYSTELQFITGCYMLVIIFLLAAGIGLIINNTFSLKAAITVTILAAIYEIYRIIDTAIHYEINPEIAQLHLGVRLSLGLLVLMCCINTYISFNKAKQWTP